MSDGSRLYIDGKLVVDNYGIHGPGPAEAAVVLSQASRGKRHGRIQREIQSGIAIKR